MRKPSARQKPFPHLAPVDLISTRIVKHSCVAAAHACTRENHGECLRPDTCACEGAMCTRITYLTQGRRHPFMSQANESMVCGVEPLATNCGLSPSLAALAELHSTVCITPAIAASTVQETAQALQNMRTHPSLHTRIGSVSFSLGCWQTWSNSAR
jgi:hypothetical protein